MVYLYVTSVNMANSDVLHLEDDSMNDFVWDERSEWPETGSVCNVVGCPVRFHFKKLRDYFEHWRKIHTLTHTVYQCYMCGNKFPKMQTLKKHLIHFHKCEKSRAVEAAVSVIPEVIVNPMYIDPKETVPPRPRLRQVVPNIEERQRAEQERKVIISAVNPVIPVDIVPRDEVIEITIRNGESQAYRRRKQSWMLEPKVIVEKKKKMGKKSKKQKDSGKRSATPPEGKELSKSEKKQVMELVQELLQVCSRQPATGAKEFEEYVEIYNMVEKIRQIQSGISSPPAPRGDNLATFQEWLTNNGVDCNVVEIAEFPGYGMGLKTKKDLQEADAILSVPRKVMITTMTARDSPLGPLIAEDKILQAMPSIVLVLHLLCEKRNPESFWKSYIDILPDKYTTPLYFTPEEIQLLKGSPSQSSCMTHYRNITRQYAYFYRLLQNNPAASKLPIKDHFTYDDYRWAVSTVSTRQNPIPSKDGSKTLFGLIPLLDMCNHCNGTISLDFCLEKDCSDCFAMREFKEGEQIFIFYGARSNSEFLVHNGFVYPENELDRLPVKLGISKSDPLCELKTELLSQLGLPASRTFQIHTGQNPIDPHLLAFLRVFSMEEEKLREFLSQPLTEEAKENFGDEEHPVSPDNEEKVWKFLETRVSLLQRAYETSIQDDEEELKKSELSEHCRLLIQLRLCEKKILQSTLEYAKNIKQTYSEQQDGAS